MTSRRSNDSEGDDSVIGGSGEPVKRLAHPAPSAPESHDVGMWVMYRPRLLYKPSPHGSRDQSIHQSVLLIQ